MKPLFIFLFCFCCFTSFSQTTNEISDPVNIPDVGWNKVVMIRNGNTLLFHFELRKQILIKVFDKGRKEIASLSYSTRKINVNMLDESFIRGVYDINGEAVVFIEQDVDNRMSLVRMRVDAVSGKVIDEVVVLQSESFTNKTTFHLIKRPASDSYAVFCFRYNIIMHPESKNELVEYNEKHEAYKTIPIPIKNKDFKYLDFLGAEFDNAGGLCISLYLSNVEITSTHAPNVYDNSPTLYNKYLLFCYLPQNASELLTKMIQVSNEVYPSYVLNSYNPFAKSINILILDAKPGYYKYGLQTNFIIDRHPLFIAFNPADSGMRNSWINFNKVNERLRQADSNRYFNGIPVKMFTNENGLTTIVSEAYSRGVTVFRNPYTFCGNITITQLDDDGNELWGTALPKAQSVSENLFPPDITYRGESKELFRVAHLFQHSKQQYVDQFMSIDCHSSKNNIYFFFNDYASNFNNSLERPGDTVSKYELTDAFYYTIDKKREIKKNYLFGPSPANESRSVFLESADFDEKTNTYAALMFHRKGERYSMQMAWCHID